MINATPNWSEKRILIVEDEEINQIFFRTALRLTGANLVFANNGLEGVEKALGSNVVDCILMDIRMPVMDGYEAMRRIKEVNPNIPIVVQTAYAMTMDRDKAYTEGCDDFISKPIRLEILYSILAKYLGN